MEAALRTAYHYATGQKLGKIEFEAIRGLEGVKTAAVPVAGTTVRVAVAHGLGHVAAVLEQVREARRAGKESPYHFIEVMACPGGCIGGGGQPYGVDNERRQKRIAGLYQDDRDKTSAAPMRIRRCSAVSGFPGQNRTAERPRTLHTRYTARPLYKR